MLNYILYNESNRNNVIHGYESGCDDFLVRPFAPEELKAKICHSIDISDEKNQPLCLINPEIVAEEGTVVDAALAGLLQRLGVEPMDIGLDLVVVYEKQYHA